MQQQKMSMPANCGKCGELFDLSYDLRPNMEREIEEELENRFVWKSKKEIMCWECRDS